MKKRTYITILGIIIALLPFTHFPGSWKNPLYTIFGLIIAYMAIPRKKIIIVEDTEEVEVPKEEPTPEPKKEKPVSKKILQKIDHV